MSITVGHICFLANQLLCQSTIQQLKVEASKRGKELTSRTTAAVETGEQLLPSTSRHEVPSCKNKRLVLKLEKLQTFMHRVRVSGLIVTI